MWVCVTQLDAETRGRILMKIAYNVAFDVVDVKNLLGGGCEKRNHFFEVIRDVQSTHLDRLQERA